MVRTTKRLLSLLALLAGNAFAQGFLVTPGGAPVFSGGGFVATDVLYDLGTLPSFVQDIEWPEDPTITQSDVNVSLDAHWTDADNTKYIVAAGTYTAKTVTCNHCEFELADNAIIDGQLTINGHHVKWVGGQKTGSGSVNYGGSGDFLLMNFHGYSQTAASLNDFSGDATPPWDRMALVNVTLEVTGNTNNGGYAFFTQMPIEEEITFIGNDLIIANSKFIQNTSGGSTFRLQGINDLVIIDSYMNPTNDGASNGGRMHCMQDVYVKNLTRVGPSNQGCARGSPFSPTVSIINAEYEDLELYDTLGIVFSNSFGAVCTNCTISNSQFHIETGSGGAPDLGTATDGGGNPNTLFWDGTTVPDASSYGASH